MTPHLVSVIVTTYNRAAFLREALESVFAQRYPSLEVIVVDDGSTDDTGDALAPYAARVRVIRRASCSHCPSVPANAGLRAADGEFIAFLDSDDVWLPGKLDAQVPLLEADSRVGIVYGDFCFMGPEGSMGEPLLPKRFLISGSLTGALVQDMFVHTSTLVVRKSLLDLVGLFDERLCTSEHYDLLLRLSRHCAAAAPAAPVAAVRQHAQQHNRRSLVANNEAAAAALAKFLAAGGLDAGIRRRARRTLGRFHLQAARLLLGEGQTQPARRHLAAARQANPLSRATWATTLRSLAGSRRG